MSSKPPHFYKDKPLFGLDIGHGSLKVMQVESGKKHSTITGYGTTTFDIHALDNGVIVHPKTIAASIRELFKKGLMGHITTRRVAMALPGYRTFSRSIQLPKLNPEELRDAVQLEVEQYVPMPLQELYLDYVITSQLTDNVEVSVVAVPKKIVDSYLQLTQLLGLEPVLIEPTMSACGRFFSKDAQSDIPSVIIDFGSLTADICIFNNKIVLATSTVSAGGLVFTEAIRNKLQISQEEAGEIKTKYGLDASFVQKDVRKALEPTLQKMVTEIRRMLRYYEERYGTKNPIGQIVMLGGGANMPGLSGYLTDELKMPVRTNNHPWAVFEHDGMKPPLEADRLMFVTVAGLSLASPKEVFAT